MKRSTFLKRMRSLDRRFLDGKLTQTEYEAKRRKLTKQWIQTEK